MDSLRSAVMQAFLEAPTRKIVRKNNKTYHMLEDSSSTPTPDEQARYKKLIRHENIQHMIEKDQSKSPARKLLEEQTQF